MKILVSACLLGISCRYDGRETENPEVMELGKRHVLIPFCPEIHGGLPTPREPSEIRDGRVYAKSGKDLTAFYEKGAQEALKLCRLLGCDAAVLQDRSPSCGVGVVHDGSFTGPLIPGDGVTAALLKKNGVRVFAASELSALRGELCPCVKRCRRHGDCAACRAHHEGKKLPVSCLRES